MKKLHNKDFSIAVKTGTEANKSKFAKEAFKGEAYYATNSENLYFAQSTAGAGDAILMKIEPIALAFQNNYSLSFDGSNDYLDISSASSAVSGQADFSISFWYYATAHPGRLIGAGTASNNRINISQPDSTFYFGVSSGPTAIAPSLNAWHHIVCVKSGTTGNIYIDGNLGGTASTLVATTSSNQGDDFSIGRLPFLNEYGNAKFDEVAVFSTALSASDITAIYNSGVPSNLSFYNPVGWWRMEEGTGTTVVDSSANSNNGTLQNGPTFSTDVPSLSFQNNYSVSLDGTDDLIETNYRPANLSLSTFSWCCWIKNANGIGNPNSTGALGYAYGTTSGSYIYGPTCITSGNNGNGFLVAWGNYNSGWNPSEFGGVGGALDILDGEWHHFAITINGTSIKIYKDGGDAAINSSNPTNNQGTPFGTKTATTALGSTAGNGSYSNSHYFTLGGYNDASNDTLAYRFSGGIDEFASWERELSGSEISKIYNNGVPSKYIYSINPHLYYRMGDSDGGTGTTLTDLGSGGNNGTLVNGPTFSTDTP